MIDKIRMDTPDDTSCNLAVVRDSDGNVIAYVATSKTGTLVTLERAGERIGCTIEDVTLIGASNLELEAEYESIRGEEE